MIVRYQTDSQIDNWQLGVILSVCLQNRSELRKNVADRKRSNRYVVGKNALLNCE